MFCITELFFYLCSTQPTGLRPSSPFLPIIFCDFFEDLVEEAVALNILLRALRALLTIRLHQIRQRWLGGVVACPTPVRWES